MVDEASFDLRLAGMVVEAAAESNAAAGKKHADHKNLYVRCDKERQQKLKRPLFCDGPRATVGVLVFRTSFFPTPKKPLWK